MRDYADKEHFFRPKQPLHQNPRPGQPRETRDRPPRKFRRVGFKILSYSFFLGTLITLGYLGLQTLENLPYFAVKEVVLEGGKHIQTQELANLAGITPEQNLLTFELGEARRRILQHPWVERATVRRRFPGRLVITVKEREPAGVIETVNSAPGGAQRFLISADGVVLEALNPAPGGRGNPGLPTIMGISSALGGIKPGQILPYENLAQSLTLINQINFNNPAPLGRIKEVHLRSDSSLILICTYLGAPLLVKAENFPAQWPLFLQFLEERSRSRRDQKAVYEYIDLRFSGKIVTKPYKT